MVTSVQASTLRSLPTLCIFMALVFSSVESYTCTECTGNACQSKPETCEASQGCFNNKQQFSQPGISPIITQDKGCFSRACTPLSFSATVRTGWTFVYENQCCKSEQCNKADIQLSPVSKEENGIVCPACFSDNGTFCTPQPLKCTGAETKCVEVTGKGVFNGFSSLTMSAMGCATESACNLKDINVIQTPTNIWTKCENPISESSQLTPIISSTLTSLLLLKVLL
uniref:protein RoBo-1 n=1 Tax=Ictidomys tridecemlineatus TaxID=43179 RepID=UPI001A9EEA29|nr:protein RoBo-1 [Ictidomys tridecemlineatus]